MITLGTVRVAVLSEKPWSEMDQLVRSELSAGRLTNQIHDELLALEADLRATPGLTEQAEDAFLDTLDLLVGFCPAGKEYQNLTSPAADLERPSQPMTQAR